MRVVPKNEASGISRGRAGPSRAVGLPAGTLAAGSGGVCSVANDRACAARTCGGRRPHALLRPEFRAASKTEAKMKATPCDTPQTVESTRETWQPAVACTRMFQWPVASGPCLARARNIDATNCSHAIRAPLPAPRKLRSSISVAPCALQATAQTPKVTDENAKRKITCRPKPFPTNRLPQKHHKNCAPRRASYPARQARHHQHERGSCRRNMPPAPH